MERDPEKLRLLDQWKRTIQSRHTVATFDDGNHLAVQVASDLGRTCRDLEEVAEARAAAPPPGAPGPVGRRPPDVVLAYGGADHLIVAAVAHGLEDAGIKVLFDRLLGTDDWMQDADRFVSKADFLVFFVSSDSH